VSQLVPVHPLVGAKGLATAGRIRTMVGWRPRSRRGLAWVAVGLSVRLLLASFLAAFVLRKYTDMAPRGRDPLRAPELRVRGPGGGLGGGRRDAAAGARRRGLLGGRRRLPSMAALDAIMCPLPPSLNPNLSLSPLSSDLARQ